MDSSLQEEFGKFSSWVTFFEFVYKIFTQSKPLANQSIRPKLQTRTLRLRYRVRIPASFHNDPRAQQGQRVIM